MKWIHRTDVITSSLLEFESNGKILHTDYHGPNVTVTWSFKRGQCYVFFLFFNYNYCIGENKKLCSLLYLYSFITYNCLIFFRKTFRTDTTVLKTMFAYKRGNWSSSWHQQYQLTIELLFNFLFLFHDSRFPSLKYHKDLMDLKDLMK